MQDVVNKVSATSKSCDDNGEDASEDEVRSTQANRSNTSNAPKAAVRTKRVKTIDPETHGTPNVAAKLFELCVCDESEILGVTVLVQTREYVVIMIPSLLNMHTLVSRAFF
jgi:hypothetical protein